MKKYLLVLGILLCMAAGISCSGGIADAASVKYVAPVIPPDKDVGYYTRTLKMDSVSYSNLFINIVHVEGNNPTDSKHTIAQTNNEALVKNQLLESIVDEAVILPENPVQYFNLLDPGTKFQEITASADIAGKCAIIAAKIKSGIDAIKGDMLSQGISTITIKVSGLNSSSLNFNITSGTVDDIKNSLVAACGETSYKYFNSVAVPAYLLHFDACMAKYNKLYLFELSDVKIKSQLNVDLQGRDHYIPAGMSDSVTLIKNDWNSLTGDNVTIDSNTCVLYYEDESEGMTQNVTPEYEIDFGNFAESANTIIVTGSHYEYGGSGSTLVIEYGPGPVKGIVEYAFYGEHYGNYSARNTAFPYLVTGSYGSAPTVISKLQVMAAVLKANLPADSLQTIFASGNSLTEYNGDFTGKVSGENHYRLLNGKIKYKYTYKSITAKTGKLLKYSTKEALRTSLTGMHKTALTNSNRSQLYANVRIFELSSGAKTEYNWDTANKIFVIK